MSRFWRLTRVRFAALDGEGARRHGGRCSPPGAPVVSLASEPALAVLITLRYLSVDRQEWPDDHVLGWTEIDAVPKRIDVADETDLRSAVAQWLAEECSLLAAVPSRVLPEADVILLNPLHPQAHAVPPLTLRPFDFAACLHAPPMLDAFRRAPDL